MAHEVESTQNWSKLLAAVWADEKLKQRLVTSPASVLKQHGIDVPAGVELRVVENTAKVAYLVLPMKPVGDATELTSSQLDAVVGGMRQPPVY